MEPINKTVRKLTGIPELDALGKALGEYERLAVQLPITKRCLAYCLPSRTMDMQGDWNYCPYCGTHLTEFQAQLSIQELAEGIAKAQIKTLEKPYTLARLQAEDALDEAREALEESKRHGDTDEEK
jgi:hypothetical protein